MDGKYTGGSRAYWLKRLFTSGERLYPWGIDSLSSVLYAGVGLLLGVGGVVFLVGLVGVHAAAVEAVCAYLALGQAYAFHQIFYL